MSKKVDIKNSLHSLIDKINNQDLLEMVYQLLNAKSANKMGELLNSLTENEREELYKAYDESFDDANLIDLEEIKKKHLKWRER